MTLRSLSGGYLLQGRDDAVTAGDAVIEGAARSGRVPDRAGELLGGLAEDCDLRELRQHRDLDACRGEFDSLERRKARIMPRGAVGGIGHRVHQRGGRAERTDTSAQVAIARERHEDGALTQQGARQGRQFDGIQGMRALCDRCACNRQQLPLRCAIERRRGRVFSE